MNQYLVDYKIRNKNEIKTTTVDCELGSKSYLTAVNIAKEISKSELIDYNFIIIERVYKLN